MPAAPAWRCMPRSSAWPRRHCAPAPISWCIRSRTRRWTRNSSRSRSATAPSIARRSSSSWATATRCRTPGSQPKPSDIALKNLRTVWDAGITVVMGTDAGNIGTLHGPSVFRELAIMTQAGLSPLQVLRSATSNGARATGRDVGVLAPGKLADVVVLDADPLADVQNLSRIHRVIKDGRIFAPGDLMTVDAAAERLVKE